MSDCGNGFALSNGVDPDGERDPATLPPQALLKAGGKATARAPRTICRAEPGQSLQKVRTAAGVREQGNGEGARRVAHRLPRSHGDLARDTAARARPAAGAAAAQVWIFLVEALPIAPASGGAA